MADTGNELSEILSEQPVTAAPETPPATTEAPATTEQPRDEYGKFASTATDAAPAVQPTVEHQPAPVTEEQPGGMVPIAALHESREKTKTLETQLAEMRGQIALLSQRQPQAVPKAPQEQPKPKDFWEAPDEFTDQRVRTALTPIEQLVKGMIFSTSMDKATAEPGGKERVAAAETAFKQAVEARSPEALAILQRLSTSFHPVGEVVNWHRRQTALNTVGNDPQAWLEAEIEKRLADPTHQAKFIERIQQTTAQQPNRQAPVTRLPSLSNLPGGTNTAAPELGDDASRFAAAIAR